MNATQTGNTRQGGGMTASGCSRDRENGHEARGTGLPALAAALAFRHSRFRLRLRPHRAGIVLGLGFAALLATGPAHGEPSAALADSVRREAGRLAADGKLDEAQKLVERHGNALPAVWRSMFAGKLEPDGETSARGYAGAAADTAPEQMRGEAVFRLGQYHYAAGRYHLAIPQFRLYLSRHPNGLWSQESAYWMAYSCLQLVKKQPARVAYLDTALAYLRRLDAKGTSAYYWPLGRAAQARAYMMRGGGGDTAAALRALEGARGRMPPEETPGLLLLSLQAQPGAPRAEAWEDSLRWNYPLSPEARLLPRPTARRASPPSPPRSTPGSAPGTHMLQLGAFAEIENAERLRAGLAENRIIAYIQPLRVGNRTLHRVVTGDYPDATTAQNEGKRLLDPLGFSFRVVAKE